MVDTFNAIATFPQFDIPFLNPQIMDYDTDNLPCNPIHSDSINYNVLLDQKVILQANEQQYIKG